MASEDITQGQYVIECDICKQPVSFFCRRCGVNLCDPCVPVHLRIKSKTGHDVVDFASRDDDDTSKIEELMKTITKENERLQNYKFELKRIIDHTSKRLDKPKVSGFAKITQQRLNSLSKLYQQKKDEVTSRGEEWHRLIDKTVKTLHQELDDMQKEHESLLQKQTRELKEILGKVDEINATTTELKNTQNVMEMKKLIARIENQETPSEIMQYSFPVFCKGKIDDNYLKSYFGYIENIQERKMSMPKLISDDPVISNHKILEMPRVVTAIDTGFPADEEYNNRLLDIVVIDDNRVWMGGESYELKLFDFQGNLHDTVTITSHGMYLTVYNKHVVYTENDTNTVSRVAADKTIQTMFTTGEWRPYGITSTASDDLLVCLLKDDQSKVVRYSGTGTVLQEIQYDSQGQPLYRQPIYITENVNGDIIVTDWTKRAVTTVDRLGIFRFSYSGKDKPFFVCAVTTDPAGHVIVTDIKGDKIHMLDRDGRFLRYIIPDLGIKFPRGVCIVGDGEMFVGECTTGVAKRIKYLEQ
ncbi:uncharacterized protein LOC125674334 [Ostrea edulis]|uniref:uncharacterized protein LOC125674334 n=1 Tax=Ostrea edulis TaxID=37623 RepID=UPI0024AFE052|nr:uncharacterized protein LOC125674334 [Ostrea edulis]XP_056015631.1 uncharacterized protein LOC125674334 [Ostrea edulis]XP_056015632.1 uncharacterized protein LOC125674334 [Ostrea edulis]